MARLPIIVGFGGYNAAGRSSFHHGFRRMVIESIDASERQQTLAGLGVMTKIIGVGPEGFQTTDGKPLTLAEIEQKFGEEILQATLVRRIEKTYYDVDAAPWQQSLNLLPDNAPVSFVLSRRQLPNPLPPSWKVSDYTDTEVRIELADNCEVKVASTRDTPVKAAGQLPSNFDPSDLYNSRFHPRALQMTIVGVSDAVHSMGIPWSTIQAAVHPDEIAVYAGNVMSQLDENGLGGVLQSRLRGNRVSAKQTPLGLNSMPADFVNAYVLGSVGTTGCTTGACATFLYNLKSGIEAIQSGRSRVVVVGNSEAPVTQEIIDGYGAMSALGTFEGLCKIEGTDQPDLRRSSRPFGENCGFTMAESTQFVILMDDELAIELGARVHGAITDVFVNADGFKKSISAPGPGNYITLAKALAAARDMLGAEAIRKHSLLHAHGSSTPANRVTESELLDRVAAVFGIEHWPVTAVKAYVGHSLGPASGDQLVSALGSFKYNLVPGIKSIEAVAADVHQEHLAISLTDTPIDDLQVVFINSKGFGGNNATGVAISPTVVNTMLTKRYGEQVMAEYRQRLAEVEKRAFEYDQAAMRGNFDVIYKFGENVIQEGSLEITDRDITLPGWSHAIEYKPNDRYKDMCDS